MPSTQITASRNFSRTRGNTMAAQMKRIAQTGNRGRPQSLATWLRINAHTLVLVGILVGGWIANFATLSARMTEVEKTGGKLEQRFDRDVVPRPEQEVR